MGHQANGCAKEKETSDLANRRTVESFAQASRWAQRKWMAVLKLRANLARSSEDGRREGTGIRKGKTECFSTSLREGSTFPT